MTSETRSKHDAKNVLSKIQHMKRNWQSAHNFATSETGAGIKVSDGESQFRDIVMKNCPYYFYLLKVMQDRSSSEPKCTTYNLGTEDATMSDVSDNDGAAAGSVATKRTSATDETSKKMKPRKSPTFIDETAIEALTASNKTMELRMDEMVHHNKAIESMEQRRFALEEQREQRKAVKLNLEQNKFKSLAWQGKNDELNYKMNLITKYKQFKMDYGWSDEQILAFFPDMKLVIDAKAQKEPTQHIFTDKTQEEDGITQQSDMQLGQTFGEE
jgi:hypothetical protein